MKKIAIGEATEAQLRKFALENLGLSIKDTAKRATVVSRIQQCWTGSNILVPDDRAETGPEPQPAGSEAIPQAVTAEQQAPAEGMVRVILGVTEEAGGKDDVQLGCNGKIMLVPRGKEVEIPERYFESLAHAVQEKFDALPDGGMDPIPRKVQLYPFQVLVSTEFTERLMRAAA